VPEDLGVSLDAMPPALTVDRDAGTVTVGAGVRLRDLSAKLAARGLSLPIVGSIQSQSIAGAIATGTHGSSLVHGNLAAHVRSMRLVTGTGDVVDLDGDDARLEGARVHLGALGVVTRVTLPVRPARRLRQHIEQLPVRDVPAALTSIAASAEYVKVWWLPHAPTAQVVRYEETRDALSRRPSAATRRWVDQQLLHRFAFPAVVAVHHRRPSTVARWNAWNSRTYLGPATQVGPDILMLNTPMPMRHRETEAAVPLSQADTALEHILAVFTAGTPPANFPLEIRFVRGDSSWLSPAHGGDTCQIGAYTTAGPDCDDYFDAFWQVMERYDARPHWGKELRHDAATLQARYPRFGDFLALRDAFDPQRMFANAFLRRVLGD
jgi:FAD/FMN-containing dehydrogenase